MKDPVKIHILNKAVQLLQPAQGFKTSLDSVMLAAACPARPKNRVLDMGCGVGGASFCLLHRIPGIDLTGIDIQRDVIDLAAQNTKLNTPDPAPTFICQDIRDYSVSTPAERYDHVICNPPYLEEGAYIPSPHTGRAIALGHTHEDIALRDWIDAGFRILQPGGTLTLIHRADALSDIIQGLGKRFGATEIIPLWSKQNRPAHRVIVRTIKDRKSPATLHAGIILHERDGAYTPEAESILRDGVGVLTE